MTARLDEYHRWMQRFSDAIRAVMARTAGPEKLAEAFDARARALAALTPPDTVEERRTLVDSLLDYAQMFNGQIEGYEADRISKLQTRQRAFDTAEPLAADDPSRAQATVMLAISLLDHGGDLRRIEALLRDGIGVMETVPTASRPWLIKARENLGLALLRQERWELAATAFAEVARDWLALPEAAEAGEPTGSLWFNLGWCYEKLGRWAEARGAHRMAVERHLAGLGPEHPHLIEARIHLGIALAALGDREEAADLFIGAMDIVQRKAGEEHHLFALARDHLAKLGTGSPDPVPVRSGGRLT
jgi:tetratricopeptide (TPR) repeat protein